MRIIISPTKLGISSVVAVVLLSGGVIALTTSEPKLTVQDTSPIPVANDRAVPTPETGEQIVTTNVDNTVEPAKQSETIDDTMDVEVIQASMEAFDPVTSGDWSLDNISDYALEITQ